MAWNYSPSNCVISFIVAELSMISIYEDVEFIPVGWHIKEWHVDANVCIGNFGAIINITQSSANNFCFQEKSSVNEKKSEEGQVWDKDVLVTRLTPLKQYKYFIGKPEFYCISLVQYKILIPYFMLQTLEGEGMSAT